MLDQVRQELEQHLPVRGISVLDAMDLPDAVGGIIKMMIRSGPLTESALASTLGLSVDETRSLAELLIAKGMLMLQVVPPDAELTYQVRFAEPRQRQIPRRLQGLFEDDQQKE